MILWHPLANPLNRNGIAFADMETMLNRCWVDIGSIPDYLSSADEFSLPHWRLLIKFISELTKFRFSKLRYLRKRCYHVLSIWPFKGLWKVADKANSKNYRHSCSPGCVSAQQQCRDIEHQCCSRNFGGQMKFIEIKRWETEKEIKF